MLLSYELRERATPSPPASLWKGVPGYVFRSRCRSFVPIRKVMDLEITLWWSRSSKEELRDDDQRKFMLQMKLDRMFIKQGIAMGKEGGPFRFLLYS